MPEAQAVVVESKKPSFCSKEYDLETGEVSFTFGNGKIVSCNISDFPAETQKQFTLHGISQKGGDSYAGVKGNFAEGAANLEEVLANAKLGIWRAGRGEGESRPRLGELAEAIARIKSVPVEQAMAAVEKATDEQRKTWRGNAKVKSVIAQLRAEAAAKVLEESAEKDLEIQL